MSANIVYKDLIEEAFIAPIRSVMVIDDEYPTLTSLISKMKNGENQDYTPANLERLQNIIKMCHEEREWVVDVFDGKTPHLETNNHIPERLRHSDLVILDYHLDGNTSQDGSKARSILKKLDSNKHFNLVIVHTNGLEGDIENVYNEILLDFMDAPNSKIFETSTDLDEKIEQWLDDYNVDEHLDILNKRFDIKDLLKLVDVANEEIALKPLAPQHIFNPFSADIIEIQKGIQEDQKEVVKWIGKQKLLEISKKFYGEHNSSTLKWYWDSQENINYICSGSVFITVIRKEDHNPVVEIYQKLINTLVKLDPSPMHLLIAKIRHHMDEIGLEQANLIIQNKFAQAGWLYNLLSNLKDNQAEHDKAIDIHWEQLGRASKTDLREFSKKLCSSLTIDANPEEICKRFFKVTKQDGLETLSNLNAFSCTIPPTSNHLTTGTILSLDDELWLTLSPACDLVPGQRANIWKERIGIEHTVIKAVKLQSANINDANKNSNTNEYLFIRDKNGVVKAYSIALANSNPTWDVFYADNSGYIDEEYCVLLTCLRKEDLAGKAVLTTKTYNAEVVAELRYAYALNFLQKLGTNQTRIGLGYTSQMFGVQ